MVEISSPDTAVATRPLRPTAYRAVLLLVPIALLVTSSYFLWHTDPDYWWHVRAGQVIVQTQSVPTTDLFSYTTPNQPWVTHTWLSEVLLYLVQAGIGYWANVLLFGLFGAATLLAVYGACRLRGMGELGAALFAFLAILVGAASANVRPQMMTVLLMATTVYLVTRSRARQSSAGLWMLPVAFLLWSNLHGGFVLGLAALWLAVLGEWGAQRTDQPAAPFAPLVLAAVASTVLTLINPAGVRAWLYPLSFFSGDNVSMRLINEWQSPDFHEPWFLVFATILLVTTIVGLGDRPLRVTDALWALLFGYLALRSVRNLPLYGVVILPILGERLLTWLPFLSRSLSGWRKATPLLAVWLIPPLVFLLAAAWSGQGKVSFQLGREPSAANYPVDGVNYLEQHDLHGNLFNDYAWGGYLVYRSYPERRVFVDGSRADAFGDALMNAYSQVADVQPGWQQVLEEYGVEVALLWKESPPAVLLESSGLWEKVFEGPVEVVLVRRDRVP